MGIVKLHQMIFIVLLMGILWNMPISASEFETRLHANVDCIFEQDVFPFRGGEVSLLTLDHFNRELMAFPVSVKYLSENILGTIGVKIGKNFFFEDIFMPYIVGFIGAIVPVGQSGSSVGVVTGIRLGIYIVKWGPFIIQYDSVPSALLFIDQLQEGQTESSIADFNVFKLGFSL